MRRIFVGLVLLAGLFLTGCGSETAGITPHDAKPDAIRFGYTSSISNSLFYVAKQMGWFEEEFKKDGITIEYDKFINGPPVIEAFAGGRLDIGQVGDQPAIQAKANQINIKAIAVFNTVKIASVVVPNDSGSKSIRDLQGKKVGVSVGSVYHRALLYFLNYYGLTAKDIKLVNMDYANLKTAIATNTIDAGVLGEPYIAAIENEQIGHRIEDHTDIKPALNVIIVNDEFARKYPDVVERILQVYAKTEKWIAENPEKANELIAKDSGIQREIVAKAALSNDYCLSLTGDDLQALEETRSFLREINIIKIDVNMNELIEPRYLKAIGL